MPPIPEFIRYLGNGLFATMVHFGALSGFVRLGIFSSVGAANLAAAAIGIITSFMGNRYFVFQGSSGQTLHQALKFGFLYAAIATIHGTTLYLWTDIMARDYRIGFCIATVFQFALSYIGNKFLVFRT
jgi:putative flippase GtrA